MSRRRSERGQTSVLILGFVVVVVLLVAVVVDASAAYLRRQQLDALADGAALAAADAVLADDVYLHGLDRVARIDPVSARQRVARYLQQVGARSEYPGLRYRVSTTASSVRVRVSVPLTLPLTPPDWVDGTRVSASAAAEAHVLG